MQIEQNQIDHQVFDTFMQESRLLAKRGDNQISINISRNTLIAILFSLLLHAVIFFVVPKVDFNTASVPPHQTIDVSLAPPSEPKVVVQSQVKKPPKKVLKSTPKVIAQQPKANQEPSFSVPDVPVIPKPSPEVLPPKESAPTDMMSYVKARQAQRQAIEADAARQNAEAVARERGPTDEQMRDERIKRNLQSGTNGIFDITSLSSRHASFSFRGWTNDYSSSRRQFFEVDASSGQDIRLIMIKKMIGLIREHYQGDFNWDSQRMGRVIVLSARLEDNSGLEDFMMTEFFGPNYKNTQ
ncbi:hypothetical protein GALL_18380 [mine drainage metagenome]|uniref:Uncharacterized protein n=1 Tax=mine drainage metagenome TaxID=410659 RepID=A0A1J5TV03_9ZZZZ